VADRKRWRRLRPALFHLGYRLGLLFENRDLAAAHGGSFEFAGL
jgi:hypothetical protein